MPGLGAVNQTAAQVGEVNTISQTYWVSSPTATNWVDYTNDFLFCRYNVANGECLVCFREGQLEGHPKHHCKRRPAV